MWAELAAMTGIIDWVSCRLIDVSRFLTEKARFWGSGYHKQTNRDSVHHTIHCSVGCWAAWYIVFLPILRIYIKRLVSQRGSSMWTPTVWCSRLAFFLCSAECWIHIVTAGNAALWSQFLTWTIQSWDNKASKK
jgi:hypothetical protein